MKHLLILLAFLMSFSCTYSRSKNLSLSDSINHEEAVMLNEIFKNCFVCESTFRTITKVHNCNYDFSDKKVAFYTGPGAGARANKNHFLSQCGKIGQEEFAALTYPFYVIYFFDEKEKSKANGYDAVIVYGSVKQYPSKKKLIRRLHKIRIFKR